MNINKNWNFRYELFFYNNKNIFKKFANLLTKTETIAYEKEIELFSNMFTFQMLIDAFNSNKDKEKILKIAKRKTNCILNTPKILKAYYQKLINKKYSKYKMELNNLLEISLNSNKTFDLYKYFSIYFDEDFLSKFLKDNPYKNCNYNPHTVCDINAIIKDFNDKNPNNLNYDIIIKKGKNYGEFWNSFLYKKHKKDTLILYNNPKWTYEDIYYTMVHEINGHAKMFDKLKSSLKFVDMSANIIIEGYATYQELIDNTNENYIKHLKYKYFDILQLSFSNNFDKMFKKYGIKTVINTNQYPAFLQSYYLGAFKIIQTKELQNLDFIFNHNFTNNLVKEYR